MDAADHDIPSPADFDNLIDRILSDMKDVQNFFFPDHIIPPSG
jgi:hypothetical protein